MAWLLCCGGDTDEVEPMDGDDPDGAVGCTGGDAPAPPGDDFGVMLAA